MPGGDIGSIRWKWYARVLTITGNGDIPDFASSDAAPWAKYQDYTERVVIENGITGIGQYAFSDCLTLFSVILPTSVTTVNANAFADSEELLAVFCTGTEGRFRCLRQ